MRNNKKTILNIFIWMTGAILGYVGRIYDINAFCEGYETDEKEKTEIDPVIITMIEAAVITAIVSISWHLYGKQMISYPLHTLEARMLCDEIKRQIYKLNQEELIEMKKVLKKIVAEIRAK